MSNQLPPRADLPRDVTWDIEAIYPTPEAWDADASALPDTLEALRAYAGTLGRGPEALAAFLSAQEDARLRVSKLMQYASMSASTDGRDPEAAARRDRAQGLLAQYAAATAFAKPELLALNPDTVRPWLERENLQAFARPLELIWRERPHVRSAEVEELLGQLGTPFASARGIHPTLVNMDLDLGSTVEDGVRVPIGQGNIDALTQHPDRDTRREAWESYADAHLNVQHGLAAALATGLRQDVFLARARHYPDSLSAALAPLHLPAEVFHNLLDTYRQHTPTWHRYWRARAKWLGLPELREYDVKAPLTANPPRVTYAQAVDWITDGMAPLGEDYTRTMRDGLTTQRWVDYGANEGKRQGAYSTGLPGGKPYIFMSWQDSLFSMSTLAHEIGHSMHSLLSSRTQPTPQARYTLFAAEVASNFNQAMVRHHLFGTDITPDFEVALIEEAMSNFHRYFFIMPTLARFELETHQRAEAGKPLSAPTMNDLMADLLSEGYGDTVRMDRERSGIMWAQFSTHLYSNFYTFQYATGISAAHQLRARFDDEPDAAREAYLTFLRAGGSLDPLDALQAAGVDMRTPEAVERTFAVLDGYVRRLEELVAARNHTQNA
ncbi:oligoendopeptidase F [Deinococcus maricopensis]|uniref:Oligopeptidase F n=1 Tax=Deinococcus maricopensis (strain DSM 21211 / LMG 22137 / NRRL B-23946 / LB-34) TaxID=709986 RepID=E8U8Y0_DEIML|nr:oligoendopeptidase F [Deinococcus maricopensis]ADV67519.1 oligoendopeptidase F [Deinococcus maricopensis DSM 21211]